MNEPHDNSSISLTEPEHKFSEKCCILCREDFQAKDMEKTLIKFSKLKKNSNLAASLKSKSKYDQVKINPYEDCRKRFTDLRKTNGEFIPRKRLRSSINAFNRKRMCVCVCVCVCVELFWIFDCNHPDRNKKAIKLE